MKIKLLIEKIEEIKKQKEINIQEFDDWTSTVSWGNENGYDIEQDQNTWFKFIPDIDEIQ